MHLFLQELQELVLTYLRAHLCTQADALFPPQSKGLSQDKKLPAQSFS